ncbi:MAG: hypothetical protein KDA41_21290 [Planctomycetales bacterium]|nr:hypothetical protein [Planctomycetales bacterium]
MPSAEETTKLFEKYHLADNRPEWSKAFAKPERFEQVEEDLFAARSVCFVLMAIVTFGALLGGLGVLLTSL